MKAKRFKGTLIIAMMAVLVNIPVHSQIYETINTLQSVLMPALSGSGRYKGFVEAGYSHTLGKYNGDFVEISTSQGYQYNNWFYMGAGLGLDFLMTKKNSDWGVTTDPAQLKDIATTAPMLPLFADFRFLIAGNTTMSFFLDLKVGCSFLLSNKYVAIGNGYLTNREYFFLDPSIGFRIPVNQKKPKQGFDFGVKYKLLTSNYWYNSNNNITLQSIGAFVGFEW